MRNLRMDQPAYTLFTDPPTARLCVSVWLHCGMTSVSSDVWLNAEQARDLGQKLVKEATAMLAATPAVHQAAE